jgi:hypothetical protein
MPPRADFDESFLGKPVYTRVRLRCNFPEPPLILVHALGRGRQRVGNGLSVSMEGKLVLSAVLRPGGSSVLSASLFCRRT